MDGNPVSRSNGSFDATGAGAHGARTLSLAAALALALAPATLWAQTALPDGSPRYVSTDAGSGRFPLVAPGRATPLHVDSTEWPGVIRAAHDLAADVGRVAQVEPTVLEGGEPAAGPIVLVGTLGRSPTIDGLVKAGKLNVKDVAGKWETFVVQSVSRPLPGIDQALVVAGSDKRGTIYGLYDLSAQIGVSPWYWWADVAPEHHDALYVLPGRHSQGEPAVKYRGIFLNDEAPALSGWTREKFGGVNSKFYTKLFELILRLKGNYLWPAMWGNAFNMDDTLNPVLADEYGIVMGTSHHEPMVRAQQEWRRVGKGEWNYEHNDSTLRAFWADGIRHMGTHESIVTVGMRGDGDMPMTQGANIALLERIVADQRRIIEQVTGKPADQTPQDWALYKEVQDYYDKGMRVPDDVTLLFSDDNWGNIRRLPSTKDRNRVGGFGIYYHFDYVGGPRSYKWIDTNPIARVWEQMRLAHEYGANRIWIVNVGDLKPMEYPISFFLDYAWNPGRIPASDLPGYARRWAAQQFGQAHAAGIADVVTEDLRLVGRRKPELLDTATYSLTNYREAETVVDEYDGLLARARRIADQLPAASRDAYYELVLHPVEATANLTRLYVTVAKNRFYARELRASTNDLADSTRQLFARDAQISAFYNDTLAGGKWRHMMDQTHIGYTFWNDPPRNIMPRVDALQVPVPADMGVDVVEQNQPPLPMRRPGAGGPPAGFNFRNRVPTLPPFDPYLRPTYHLDVYNRGRTPFRYAITTGQPWLVVTPAAGTVTKEQRVAVSVDWARAPVGTDTIPITITGPDDSRVVVRAPVVNPATPRPADVVGFVESDGVVSMEAEHYTRAVGANGIRWERIPDFGRTLSGVDATPVTAASQTPGGNAPHLEYRMVLFDTGAVKVHAYISPTWDFTGGKGLRFAVSFDDQPPQIVNIHADGSSNGITDGNPAFEQGVANNIKVLVSDHRLAQPGVHVLKYWMVDPGIVLQKLVVATKELPATYLGPPESFHGLATAAPTTALKTVAAPATEGAP